MIAFPPSPALSACDSLDGIDLDALLDAQGSLSHFPTPPLKEIAIVGVHEEDEHAFVEYNHIAELFLDEASRTQPSPPSELTLIRDVLWRAQLPPEVLALAFNILAQHAQIVHPSQNARFGDLLTVCAMTLAVSLTNDHPPTSEYWSRHICDSAWTARQIDQNTLGMLMDLDWRLHELGSPHAIEATMGKLFALPCTFKPAMATELVEFHVETHREELLSLELVVATSGVCWAEGQLTPDTSRPCSAVGKPSQDIWLRLL